MSREDGTKYNFACPECGETIEVDGQMREALVEQGCVTCGATVPASSFTEATSASS